MRVIGPDPRAVTIQNLHDFLAVRKRYFVDQLGWDVPHTSEREFDQYDLPDALYCIAYHGADCIGGARIMPTNAETAQFFDLRRSYMLQDFATTQAGGLTDQHLKAPLPATYDTWEMTRFVGSTPKATAAILGAVNDYLHGQGVRHVLTLSPVLMPRVLRRLGYQCRIISDPVTFDGKEFVTILTDVREPTAKRLAG